MPGRLIAIGDIHGYSKTLATLLAAIDPQPDDTLVALGDFVDRGPDSPGVIEQLIALQGRCRLVTILGNHDEMMLSLRHGGPGLADWLSFGGRETLEAYGCGLAEVPETHIDFLRACSAYYETSRHFFVHASYLPDLPLDWQPPEVLRWESLKQRQPGPHYSGKTALCGHTAQDNFEILDLGHLKCIDTCCYGGGWLTALEVQTGQVWQADQAGKLRTQNSD
jgi:serine/threonine protein phosphatase 1